MALQGETITKVRLKAVLENSGSNESPPKAAKLA
jgi:hypothetical protein